MAVQKERPKDDKLISIIKEDTKLSPDIRMEFVQLAREFLSEFSVNMSLTSIELDNKYGYGMDGWQQFLAHPSIKKYVDSFLKEIINKNVDTALSTGAGTRDAISVKKEMERASGISTNEMFVVFRLPDKEDVYELSGEI